MCAVVFKINLPNHWNLHLRHISNVFILLLNYITVSLFVVVHTFIAPLTLAYTLPYIVSRERISHTN